MLIRPLSSLDFACCWRATLSARSKSVFGAAADLTRAGISCPQSVHSPIGRRNQRRGVRSSPHRRLRPGFSLECSFRWNAASVDAGAAEQFSLDHGDLHAGINQASGRRRPCLSGSDDDCVVLLPVSDLHASAGRFSPRGSGGITVISISVALSRTPSRAYVFRPQWKGRFQRSKRQSRTEG
jgi:hypothetical protein